MMNTRCFFLLTLLLLSGFFCLPAGAAENGEKEEGVREQWGEFYLVLREPVVTQTAVENGRRLARLEAAEARRAQGRSEDEEGDEDDEAEVEELDASPRPTAEDCGLHLFTVSSSTPDAPAPTLRWKDQNKLQITFAPGSSPQTEYRLVFRPGTTYLGGAPLATASFSFRCKPAEFRATWLQEHAGGAALLSALGSDTREAQQLAQRHEGLRVCFRRVRHVPMVGWVCTGTVPARLRPATVGDGFGGQSRVFTRLLETMAPEDIREETLLPQCLVALPEQPLVPGAYYELGVEAAAGSGFKGEELFLNFLPDGLQATLERELRQEAGVAPATRLKLSFNMVVPEAQLRALWERLGVVVNGVPAVRQADGSYRVELAAGEGVPPRVATLRLHGLLPAEALFSHWSGQRQKLYAYAPHGCAQGLLMDVESAEPLEIHLTLPEGVQTRHGLAFSGQRTLSASVSPAAPALTGNGSNLIALSGQHRMELPLINVGEVTATAYHWDAASAARLLPVIQHGMRDDTVFCELWQRLCWMRRRADEGLSTEGWMGEGDDARTEAGRALHLLQKERRASDAVRGQALAAASAFAPQSLALHAAEKGNGLLREGRAVLDMDQLTGGQLRPGLYLISLSYRPTAEVVAALLAYGMSGEEAAMDCTVDFLVQVTDMSLSWGQDRLLVNSLTTGQPLEGGQVTLYSLPDRSYRDGESERREEALREAVAVAEQPVLSVTQGEVVLPKVSEEKLLLLQRGEDYALLSLWGQRVASPDAGEASAPMLKLFCDRPLYRPGEVVHLRGVLRRPVKGGLALLRAQRGTLQILKPNGEVLETQEVRTDAYGAFAADVRLPAGEEDVAGRYLGKLRVEESGKMVETELVLPCEVFRRDAFTASLRLEMDPVAPKQYRVDLQAVDYNGTPLAGGKVVLELGASVPLLDEAGKEPQGLRKEQRPYAPLNPEWQELRRELVLDAEGRASVSGSFGAYEKLGYISASASFSNDREEYVQLPQQGHNLAPADFVMELNGHRLRLLDARSMAEGNGRPLERAQEVELCVDVEEKQREEMPSGIWCSTSKPRQLSRRRITVPANCAEGVELKPWLPEGEGKTLHLRLSGRDAEGRLVRKEVPLSPFSEEVEVHSLTAEGGSLRLESATPFRSSGRVHACISSQGQRRHALVEVKAGERSVTIPLTKKEYGSVRLSLVSCEKDSWGTFTRWEEREASCELPRPDKELKLEFGLPAGAKPGEKVALEGRVLGADGQPVKAAVTFFAVDAGMMSVGEYSLPEFARSFYLGRAERFSLERDGYVCEACEPWRHALPNVWSREGGGWSAAQPSARLRSVLPPGMNVGSFDDGSVGSLFRYGMYEVLRAAQPNFRWSYLLDFGQNMQQYAPAPSPAATPVVPQKAVDGARAYKSAARKALAHGAALEEMALEEEAAPEQAEVDALRDEGPGAVPPRLRRNFEPVALWLASLESGADGCFRAECTLPDTLTTYKVYAVALDAGGSCFGRGEGEFLVSQQLMLTPGTPFFMSTGDRLLLPLTVTNNRDEAGEWTITLDGAGDAAAQQVQLEARSTATLYFDVKGGEEGESVLRWTARSADSADAVEGRFPVRYPAPLLKEAHRLVLADGQVSGAGEAAVAGELPTASLLAPEVAAATRGEVEVRYSTSPLIHLAGSVDFLLSYPYGCTEQRASALLPWLFYEHLAPFCPQMAMNSAAEAREMVTRCIDQLLARQQKDGGLSYWAAPKGEPQESCAWASAYAGLVLTLAQEQGFAVPEAALTRLRGYLGRQSWRKSGYQTQYAVARARGRSGEVNRILVRALRRELKRAQELEIHGFDHDTTDLEFLAALSSDPAGRHAALLTWLRSKGRDYRHQSSWCGGWTLIALAEYLRLQPRSVGSGSVLINGDALEAGGKPGSVRLAVGAGQSLRDVAPTLAAGQGNVYVSLHVKGQPEQTEYPGVTEKGLQVTRVYEVKDAQGQWREAREFAVGDVVRVTLTCAKMADELEYFVLEDYLPACMEAINPNVPGQAAGLEDGGWCDWSHWFDHKEYLADRVRGFCTRWAGRDVVNMRYYARVKRAGECTAAPAAAQLMYEPQIYGLSPNARVRSK